MAVQWGARRGVGWGGASEDGDDEGAIDDGDPHLLEELSHAAPNRARRASVALALATLQEAGHDTAMGLFDEESETLQPFQNDRPRPPSGNPEDAWIGAVQRCVLLAALSPSELRYVLSSARPMHTVAGQYLFQQGDILTGGMMYVAASGNYRATVVHGNQMGGTSVLRTRDYGPQDTFGASDLLCRDTHGERTCSVHVLRAGLVWGIPQRVVDGKLRIPTPSRIPRLLSFCRAVELFAGCSRDRLEQLCRGAQQIVIDAGEIICEEGDLARTVYAVKAGSVVVSNGNADKSLALTVRPPDTFGESALLAIDELRVRKAMVAAGDRGACLIAWDVSAIETLVGFGLQVASVGLQNRMLLESVRCGDHLLTDGLSVEQLVTLTEVALEHSYDHRAHVLEEGDLDVDLYIVQSGEAVMRREVEPEYGPTGHEVLCHLKRGDVFGEQALLALGGQMSFNDFRGDDDDDDDVDNVDDDDDDEWRGPVPVSRARRTSVVVRGRSPFICLVLSPEVLFGIDSLVGWTMALLARVEGKCVRGVDAVLLEALEVDGNEPALMSLTAGQAFTHRLPPNQRPVLGPGRKVEGGSFRHAASFDADRTPTVRAQNAPTSEGDGTSMVGDSGDLIEDAESRPQRRGSILGSVLPSKLARQNTAKLVRQGTAKLMRRKSVKLAAGLAEKMARTVREVGETVIEVSDKMPRRTGARRAETQLMHRGVVV